MSCCKKYQKLDEEKPESSSQGRFYAAGIKFLRSLPGIKDEGMFKLGKFYSTKKPSYKLSKTSSFKLLTLQTGAKLELLTNTTLSTKVIYQLHGGGYVIGLVQHYRNWAVTY